MSHACGQIVQLLASPRRNDDGRPYVDAPVADAGVGFDLEPHSGLEDEIPSPDACYHLALDRSFLGAGKLLAALGVAVLSYNGQLDFGVTGDWDILPDLDVFAAGLEEARRELLDLSTPAEISAGVRAG